MWSLTRLFSFYSLIICSSILLQACTHSVLSRRTDEQAWNEYRAERLKELRARRIPASERNELADALEDLPVRKWVLECDLNGGEACYQKKLASAFDGHSKKRGSASELERRRFMNEHSWENLSNEVQRFHELLLSGIDLRAVERVRRLHQSCENVSQAYYDCVNLRWSRDQTEILNETAERLGLVITTIEAKNWIKTHQIQVIYSRILESILAKSKIKKQESRG
jgi:hypothetical protein